MMEKSYQDRAKQFLPYASLRGFDAVVEKRRELKCPRRELLSDAAEELSCKLASLSLGTLCRVNYYLVDKYVVAVGRVTAIDVIGRRITVGTSQVPIDDIFSLEIEN